MSHSVKESFPFVCIQLLEIQAVDMFGGALQTGQLGPLMQHFGLPPRAVEAANRGGTNKFFLNNQNLRPKTGQVK